MADFNCSYVDALQINCIISHMLFTDVLTNKFRLTREQASLKIAIHSFNNYRYNIYLMIHII